MRSRAEAAVQADCTLPWTSIPTLDPDNDGWVVTHKPSDADYDTTVAQCIYDFEGKAAEHIASWHPTVALAVADWLDFSAKVYGGHYSSPKADSCALTVARAYLGSDA
jgi:hypothetical protein